MLNDIVHGALGKAGIAATKEPSGLLAGSSLRPDGATLIPWSRGKCLAWDATTPDTLCISHLPTTRNGSGAAAEHSAVLKGQKYRALSPTYHFVAVAVDSGAMEYGGIGIYSAAGKENLHLSLTTLARLSCYCRGFRWQCSWRIPDR